MPRLLRLLPLVLLAALTLTACGNRDEVEERAIGEIESHYMRVGELRYQVQISRQLNPNDTEDAYYLRGVPEDEAELDGRDETWFGVFIRVENPTDEQLTPTTQFEIEDTLENVYEPIELEEANAFRYTPRPLGPGGLLPAPSSPAGQGTINGALLLFKIKRESYENRPLEFVVSAPGEDSRGVDLDL
jgi:hypothetical protein